MRDNSRWDLENGKTINRGYYVNLLDTFNQAVKEKPPLAK